MTRCSTPRRSFVILDLNTNKHNDKVNVTCDTYAMGPALAHLPDVGSPYALIFFALPNISMHRGSFLTWSAALLNWLILLSGANTSVYSR